MINNENSDQKEKRKVIEENSKAKKDKMSLTYYVYCFLLILYITLIFISNGNIGSKILYYFPSYY